MDILGTVYTSKLNELTEKSLPKNGNPSSNMAFRDDILAYLDSKFNKVFKESKK